jgi:hypothetical protein
VYVKLFAAFCGTVDDNCLLKPEISFGINLKKAHLVRWVMQDATGERWKSLCKEASTEQDPERLLELVQEINRLIDEKRLGMHSSKAESQPSSE